MKKFVKTCMGMVLVIICLIVCSCTTEPLSDSSNDTSNILEFSKIIIRSSDLLADLEKGDCDLKIFAYAYGDLVGAVKDEGEYQKLLISKLSAVVEEEAKEQSDEDREAGIAKIEADFSEQVRLLESKWQKEKYDEFSKWLLDNRDISSEVNWEEGQVSRVSLTAYSMGLDDLIALQESNMHVCYIVESTTKLIECG